jgi:hypothetical protein
LDTSDKPAQKQADKSFHVSDLKVGTWRVKLRLDQTSLEPNREEDSYKKTKGAKFSVAEDQLKNETKYDVRGTLAVDSDRFSCVKDIGCRLITYVKREQTATSPKSAKSDIDRTVYGSLGYLYVFPRDSFVFSVFSFDSQYIVDQTGPHDTEAFGHTARWRPSVRLANGPYGSIPGREINIFNYMYFGYEYGAMLRYGQSLSSTDLSFQRQKDFMYFGPEIDAWLIGAKGTFLESFKLLLHYNILYREHGLFKQVPYFNAELSYALDKEGDVDISLTYERGREYELFEKRQMLKAALGYKF